ncbi:MAG: leucine-rich repeat domain-containing protein, partial [Bacteroidales bacterium]|nr:leucine-rich repeat domain-containing protein [Bacteroidales bacterium]
GDIKSGSEYYIAVAPGTYADGITIKMVSADNKYGEYTTSTGLEIRPNSLRTFSKLSTVEFNMLSKNMSYVLSKCSESETQTIELADYEWKTVRTALLNNLSKKVYLKLPENGMTSIPDYAFYDYRSSNLTNLVNIDIPKTVTHIGQEAFHNCEKLVHANLPSGLNYIGPYSFMYCEKLVLEEIPSSVTEIRSYAFLGCKSLQNLTINSSPTFGSDVFLGCSPSLKVNVNDETYLKYGDEGKPYHNVMVDPRPDAPGAKVSVEGTSNGSDIN